MNNIALAEVLRKKCYDDNFTLELSPRQSAEELDRLASQSGHMTHRALVKSSIIETTTEADPSTADTDIRFVDVSRDISKDFEELDDKFVKLLFELKNALVQKQVTVSDLQFLLQAKFEIQPYEENKATFDKVFSRIINRCCIFYCMPRYIVKTLLSDNAKISQLFCNYEIQIDQFLSSTKMRSLVTLIKNQRIEDGQSKLVVLKVREYWENVTFKKFERFAKEILGKLYDFVSLIRVEPGSLAVSWVIPAYVNVSKLFHILPISFIEAVGVISLHIGEDEIYNLASVKEGCTLMEAAMLQAIELKNKRAVEVFLAVGCNPEIVSCLGKNAISFIAHIRNCESKAPTTEYVCFFDSGSEPLPTDVSPLSLENLMVKKTEKEISDLKKKHEVHEKMYEDLLHENQKSIAKGICNNY